MKRLQGVKEGIQKRIQPYVLNLRNVSRHLVLGEIDSLKDIPESSSVVLFMGSEIGSFSTSTSNPS